MLAGEQRVNALKRLIIVAGKWEYTWLCVIVLVSLALHFSLILMPPQPIYDEQFYVDDARSILAGQSTLRPEHPSLGKLFVVAGISIFGDGPMGWRFFSVVFGAGGIILFYLICRQLAMSRRASSTSSTETTLETPETPQITPTEQPATLNITLYIIAEILIIILLIYEYKTRND
jgi:hypothetical protein